MPTADYFLNTPSSTVALETLEISHPSFSQVYRIVRNHSNGFTGQCTDEVGSPNRTFTYYPCNIQMASSADDLEYTLQVTFGDLGEILPTELDRVFNAGTIKTKPTVKYRVFESNGTTHTLIYYGDALEIKGIAFNSEGCTFEASPVLTNSTSIGMRYTTDVFEGLRGFV